MDDHSTASSWSFLHRSRAPVTGVPRVLMLVLCVVMSAVGAFLVIGGAILAVLGGAWMYVALGALYLLTAWWSWRVRPTAGIVAGVAFCLTLVWSVMECGTAFWPAFARLLIPAALAAFALVACATLLSDREATGRGAMIGAGAASGLVMMAMLLGAFFQHGAISPASDMVYVPPAVDGKPSDWSAYGRTTAGTRFTPSDQINRETVSGLQVAWTFRTGDLGPGVDQNTPLQIGDTIYACSRNDHIDAIDANSGKLRWAFDPKARSPIWQRCRSLGYYHVESPDHAPCGSRIFNTTIDARLIALDAETGALCRDFGADGVVDLKAGQGVVKPGFYFQSSGPLVARDRIVIGGWVVDNQQRGEPSGVIRAFDARTGALVWAWDLGDPSITKDPPPGGTYTRGTPNMWTHAAYDDALGLVYIPLGNETPDYYSPGRNPRSALYNSTLVALDVNTGRERWRAQTVHHDLWDYDLPAQPALVDIPDGHGGMTHAVLQITKRGQLFLYDRATGAPVSRVVERPVPTSSTVPEEHPSPTQPFSIDMPVIGDAHLRESDAWGMTILDQLICRIEFRRMRYDGDFTPIGLDWSIEQPSNIGGLNWGSVAYDPTNAYAYMVDTRIPGFYKLVPRADYAREAAPYPKVVDGHGPSPQMGTPYGMITELWLSPLGVPCSPPPFGTISAVDLKTRRIAWQIPAGTSEEVGPLGIKSHLPMPVGLPAYAGTSITAGGLVFFAGFQDFYLRAYDAATGRELWRHALPVGSSATPMSYVSPTTGREYVLISVGGAAHSKETGDYIIAFALPR